MRLLLINWQDRLNPHAGGAEIHLHEVFGRLAARGHQVSLLVSGFPGAPDRAEVDGLQVHRVGGRHSFPFRVASAGRALLARQPFELVIEALNKLPVFAPRWVDRPTVLLVHHLFGSTAFRSASLPIALATWLSERPLARVYRGVPVETISESTAEDLVGRGLRPADIEVIHVGVDLHFYHPAATPERAAEPTFVYVGRLQRYKGVELILRAIADLVGDGTAARLVIAGKGDHEPALRALAGQLRLGEQVEFVGFISEGQKRDLFRRAWANVYTSPKEGWGITVLEAGACGTPTVASNSPGLREAVRDGDTGLLVPHGSVPALAAALRSLAENRERVETLGLAARAFASHFTWERAADRTEAHLRAVLDRNINYE